MKLASIPVCFLILIACGSQAIAQTNGPPFRCADSLRLLDLGMNPVAALQAGDPPVHTVIRANISVREQHSECCGSENSPRVSAAH